MKTTTRTIAGSFLLVGLLAGVLTAGTAWGQAARTPAQNTTPAQPALVGSEASRREARALGEKLGWEAQGRGIINTLRTTLIVNIAQANGKTPQDMIGVVDDLLMPDFVGDAGGLQSSIVEAWAGAFTAEELRNLRTFYNTPLGNKLLRAIPQLSTVIHQASQIWAQKVYTASQQKHADEFIKRGLKFVP